MSKRDHRDTPGLSCWPLFFAATRVVPLRNSHSITTSLHTPLLYAVCNGHVGTCSERPRVTCPPDVVMAAKSTTETYEHTINVSQFEVNTVFDNGVITTMVMRSDDKALNAPISVSALPFRGNLNC